MSVGPGAVLTGAGAGATPRDDVGHPAAAVAGLTVRLLHRGALVVIAVTAGMSAVVVASHG
ncbi:MAG: hypothetical protein M3235_06370, partial [Actinomycetota bacterium]|nr:hypothetical protein [Actinomycetota bacterium]